MHRAEWAARSGWPRRTSSCGRSMDCCFGHPFFWFCLERFTLPWHAYGGELARVLMYGWMLPLASLPFSFLRLETSPKQDIRLVVAHPPSATPIACSLTQSPPHATSYSLTQPFKHTTHPRGPPPPQPLEYQVRYSTVHSRQTQWQCFANTGPHRIRASRKTSSISIGPI